MFLTLCGGGFPVIDDEFSAVVPDGPAGPGEAVPAADGAGQPHGHVLERWRHGHGDGGREGTGPQHQGGPGGRRSGDVEMLEDLVLAAIAEAQQRAQQLYEEELKKVAGGFSLPFNLPNFP
jgi:hypothetical protein